MVVPWPLDPGHPGRGDGLESMRFILADDQPLGRFPLCSVNAKDSEYSVKYL